MKPTEYKEIYPLQDESSEITTPPPVVDLKVSTGCPSCGAQEANLHKEDCPEVFWL